MASPLLRIVDMHTHLFNARCLPLAGILANGIRKDADQSPIARSLSDLVNHLTESDHVPDPLTSRDKDEGYYIRALSEIAEQEWITPSKRNRLPAEYPQALQAVSDKGLREKLERVVRSINIALPELGAVPVAETDDKSRLGQWIRQVVKRALTAFLKVVVPHKEIGNYVEFVFNMLTAETRMAETLIHGYGAGLPPLHFVHHMMDMQMGYVTGNTPPSMVEPYYPFGKQLERMARLAEQFPRIHGFSAFDPRREEWEPIATRALKDGFVGFKFYPAMGYRPFEDENLAVRQRIYAFFDFCIKDDIPVFAHCTPRGFETRFQKGRYADPASWEKLLASENGRFAKLRLCLGHGGGDAATGGNDHDGYITSPGWTAEKADWKDSDNYANTVVRLCRQFENVYCDLAYFTSLYQGKETAQANARTRFAANLKRELTEGDGVFANKVCFGTDWHMPQMVAQPRQYLSIFLELFRNMFEEERAFVDYANKFFWQNAFTFMKLPLPSAS